MLNVEETLVSLPELSDDDLETLQDTVKADESLTDDEREELFEAIEEEWDERDEEDEEDEDDVFADEIDSESDDDEEDGLEIE